MLSKYSSDLSRQEIKELFDVLNERSGKIYLCEKLKDKYKAITLKEFYSFFENLSEVFHC